MGTTKKNLFTEEQNRLAQQAKALAHPARVAIFQLLIRRGTCVCGDITDELPLSQATVSQHLKVMKEAGLIQGNIEGTRTCYCLDKTCCSGFLDTLVRLGERIGKCC